MDTDNDLLVKRNLQESLPEPQLLRWQPLRIGLVNLFYYDSEEFCFNNGHLVLRGNNGTGKSKVLSLTMPLLLDAEVKSSRVEPDADSTKKMAWNLLVGEHDRRIGYSWIEFGRVGEDGVPRYLMLGAGLSAAAARPKVDSWFFLVEGGADCPRVNRDFWMTEDDKGVLSERKLRDLVHNRIGRVFDTAEAYRRAVDERLFSLGRNRYGALMDTLIQLRRPHLSEKPDEGRLSNALSESLPPIAADLLTDVAAALGGLEDDRLELDGYEKLSAAVVQFEKRYRVYAATQSRRQTKLLRQAQTEFDNASREFSAAQERQQEALRHEEQCADKAREADLALTAARAAWELILQDPAMKDANSLQRAEAVVSARNSDVKKANESVERQRNLLAKEESHAAEVLEQLNKRRLEIGKRRNEAHAHAEGAGLLTHYESSALHITTVDELSEMDAKLLESADSQLRRAVGVRKDAISTVRRRLDDLVALESALRMKQELFDEANDTLTDALGAQVSADESFEQLGNGHMEAWERHVAALKELTLDVEEVIAALEPWVRSVEGEHPALHLLRKAHTASNQNCAELRSQLRTQVQETQDKDRELHAERVGLTSGVDPEPPAPRTREVNARVGRAGAPLWKLIDFKESVGGDQRAGLEAALEGAGLLDAWVNGDGSLEPSESVLDTTISPRGSVAQPLSQWLVASCPEGSEVSEAAVHALLDGIAAGVDESSAETWIGVDGRYRLGGLSGRWRKPSATYVGYTARALARASRLAAIEAERTLLAAILEGLASKLTEVDEREMRAEEDRTSAPSDSDLRNALAECKARAQDVTQKRNKVLSHQATLEAARNAREAAKSLLARDAGDLNLPADKLELQQAGAGVDSFASVLPYLTTAIQGYLSTFPQYQVQLDREADVRETWEIEAEKLESAQNEAAKAKAEYEVLHDRVGLRVDELENQLRNTRKRVDDCDEEFRKTSAAATDALAQRAVADNDVGARQAAFEASSSERGRAVQRLQRFALSGIFSAGVPDIVLPDQSTPWTIDPALTVARKAEQLLSNVDDKDATWERVQKFVGDDLNTLQTNLSALGYQCMGEQTDFGQVVTVLYRNKPERPERLTVLLREEIAQRRELLDAKEREVLENHLQAEIASAVQRLLQSANRYVVDVNGELERRPTSTGVKFRLVWEPLSEQEGAPVGLAEAREKLLNRSSDLWTIEDRAVVGAMLRQRIAAERDRAEAGSGADVGASLADQLARALDYRLWHRFRVERWQGGWRKLTGPASSGERALGLTVPLFAAVCSFYGKGKDATAPRLMLLDEAFAGIDDAARAQLMALIREFDLDFIITSEREWGCYAALPGVSICQLQRRPGVDAVFVSRWVWDGKAKTPAPDPNRRFPSVAQ